VTSEACHPKEKKGMFMSKDEQFMHRAIEVALHAEREGNPPVGAVITLANEVVAEGGASVLVPKFDGTRHAEMEALRAVPGDLWESSDEMSLYTTLEPCLMCFASILIHGIGRIVFGASDSHGGAGYVQAHLPPYFRKRMAETQWLGPIMPVECDPLYERLLVLLEETQRGLV
jgi:tRNA(adenine34) deaminase